jgi:hypothetical protein
VHSCNPAVISPTDWRPSAELREAVADCLLAVADQRRAQRLAHTPDGAGPDNSLVMEESSLEEG